MEFVIVKLNIGLCVEKVLAKFIYSLLTKPLDHILLICRNKTICDIFFFFEKKIASVNIIFLKSMYNKDFTIM